jgi:hypothetical protein
MPFSRYCTMLLSGDDCRSSLMEKLVANITAMKGRNAERSRQNPQKLQAALC